MGHPEDGELNEWWQQTWGFAKQILPLLFIGVLISGFLLGRPGHEGIIPSAWGGLGCGRQFFALQLCGVIHRSLYVFCHADRGAHLARAARQRHGQGAGAGLLLAGPALSLPNMLVIRSVLGTKKIGMFVSLVVVMATLTGITYGTFFG